MNFLYQRPTIFFTCVVFLISGYYFMVPDFIPLNNGFGFEGAFFYKDVAKDFYNVIFIKGLNSYSIQRILPFALMHYIFKIFTIQFTDKSMLIYFEIYNFGLAILIIYYWKKTSKILKMNIFSIWIGYLGLLFNFATLKYDLYVPFTYDRTALLVGMMSVYYHLAQKDGCLFVTALASLLVWPTALYCNILLLLVPAYTQLPVRGNKKVSLLWAAGCGTAFVLLCVYVIYIKHIEMGFMIAPVVKWLLPLSIFAMTVYMIFTQYIVARQMFPDIKRITTFSRLLLIFRKSWVYILLILVFHVLLTRWIGTQGKDHLNISTFLVNVVYGAVSRPLQALISHSNYYGLPVILALLYWRQIGPALKQLGFGIGGLFMFLLLLSVNCETRQLANLLPVLVVVTSLAVAKLTPSIPAIFASTLLCLIQSKFWLRINSFDTAFGQPSDKYPLGNVPGAEYVWNSPFQAYFMNIGPWTSNQFLSAQAVVLLAMLLLIRWLYGKQYKSFLPEKFDKNST